jgi:DNA processing protein
MAQPPHSPEAAALVALLRRRDHPWQTYADLIEEAGSAAALLVGDARQARLFDDAPDEIEVAAGDVKAWGESGLELVTVLDAGYPANLLACHDRPPFVFVAGRLSSADATSVAVIGSRDASDAGLRRAASFSSDLVALGYTVISGLAAGIDATAHEAALAAGGRTVAVIGTGLHHCYPSENCPLQRRIAQQCAVVSQFWPDTRPSRRTFPLRNGTMSGIALGTLIVEASHTSGTRVQARLALGHGRPVFLLEPLLSQDWARELAAKPGTHVVGSAAEVHEIVARLNAPGMLEA